MNFVQTFLSSALPFHDPLWITAIGGLITACGGVAGGMFGAISAISKSHRETEKKLDSIRELAHDAKEQTTNNHGTNLRDDIDKLDEKLDHIAQTQSLLGQELTAHGQVLDQLQAAQRQDRSERMTLDSQAHDEHERLWKELDRIKNRL
ncbi:MAG: hypothetical protein E7E13_08170 [Actinomyces sp.]|uniref:hypothetical protein n=1 Tax=Actinomyces sp. TaxID=29317 RepID=UPI002900CB48|nr:hypothetical protein [Actinomyces sp.]MDU2260173.1 hypothetical protein [Actinomyces sp.]